MANIVACQTLGEMSTHSKAERYATRNMADSQPKLPVHRQRDNTAQIHRNLTSTL
jgi:hypothetical protein